MFSSHTPASSIFVTLGILVVVLILRNRQARRLRIELLWVRPAIFIVLMGATLFGLPPPFTVTSILIMAAGLATGCALGWQRGKFMRLDIHPETHDMTIQASVVGMIFIVALVAVRYLLSTTLVANASSLHLPVLAISDAFVLLAGGVMATQGLEVWLRARRMLADAVAAKATSGA
jgi:Protein of unknown function (DUF1453)